MTATSTEQSTDNSCAFLNSPPLRLRKVLALFGLVSAAVVGEALRSETYTDRLRSSLMALISIFRRPMMEWDVAEARDQWRDPTSGSGTSGGETRAVAIAVAGFGAVCE